MFRCFSSHKEYTGHRIYITDRGSSDHRLYSLECIKSVVSQVIKAKQFTYSTYVLGGVWAVEGTQSLGTTEVIGATQILETKQVIDYT